MDGLKVEIITRNFSRMLEELAAIDSTIEFKDVVDGVATRVAQGAMNRTRAAKASAIKARYEAKEWTTFNGKKVRIGGDDAWHFPDQEWASIQAKRNELLQLRLAARGTAKQNWLGFAQQLGRTLSAPAYVLGANYKGRTHESDSRAHESGSGTAYTLTLLQTSPLIYGAQMERALLSAMSGETRYFYINMEKRAFATFASRAAKYPGIFARQGATV